MKRPGTRAAYWRNLRLRWIIFFSYLLLLGFTWVLLSLGLRVMMGYFLWESNRAHLLDSAQAGWFQHAADERLHRQATDYLPAVPAFPGESERLAQRMCSRETYVRILDARGSVLAARGEVPQPPPLAPFLMETLRQPTGNDRPQAVSYASNANHRPWQVLVLPVLQNTNLVGMVQICADYTAPQKLLSVLEGYLALGSVAGGVLALVITWWLAARLALPMIDIAEAARKVQAGDLSARSGVLPGKNEIFTVAAAFDDMVEQMEQTILAQKRFVADASHELKSPLTAIGGMTEILSVGNQHQRSLATATIEKEVDRMTLLVADLLTLSRAEQNAGPELEPVEIGAMLQEVLADVREIFPDRDYHLVAAGRLLVRGHSEQLKRVVRNLLENAVQYSAEGTVITVRASSEPPDVRVSVEDRGCGIAPEDLPRVFDRFYRADRSRARKTGGTGLGLAIVRAVVQQHGGRVEAQSTPGEGSTFSLYLPGSP